MVTAPGPADLGQPTSPEPMDNDGKGENRTSPLLMYSARGGLRQDPGRAAESLAEARTWRKWESRNACAVADRAMGRAAPGVRANRLARRPQIGADDVNPLTTSAFDLPGRLAAKADPALIAGDEQHFAAIAESLEQSIADLSGRLEAERRAPGGIGQEAMDRDMEIHRLTARLRTLRRFGLDLCLGRMVGADNPEPVYVGRLGLTDSAGRRLLLDWRSPAAEPFFGATHANPMGLASRRRYRWTRGRISDYWDEVFTAGRARRARRARRPVRLHRQPGQQPVGPDAGRARHHPGRPGRHHPRGIPRRSRRRRRSRARARPSSRCTAPPTSCTPTLASATAGAACCSSARTSPTWPTSPTCCPASARRACRPAPCGTSSPRAPRQRRRPTRRWPA